VAPVAGGAGVTASGRPGGAEGRAPESSGLRPGNVLSTSGLLAGRTPRPQATCQNGAKTGSGTFSRKKMSQTPTALLGGLGAAEADEGVAGLGRDLGGAAAR